MIYTEQDILALLQQGERVSLECKRAENKLPRSIWETYSSFANTNGGIILLGIDEVKNETEWGRRYPIIGVKDSEKLLSDFWNMLNDARVVNANLLTDDDVQVVDVQGVSVVLIKVPRADYRQKPIYIKDNLMHGAFKRNHEGDYHCSESDVRAMIRDANEDGNDGLLLEDEYDMSCIDMNTLRAYRQMFQNKNIAHSLNTKDDVDFLRCLGGCKVDKASGKVTLTMAGLLVFGQGLPIRERFPMIRMDYIDKSNLVPGSRYSDRLTYDCDWENNLFQFITETIRRLCKAIPVPFVLDGVTRDDDPPLKKLVREAVTNMVIHADFMMEGVLRVEKDDNGYLFSNPGYLKLPVEDIFRGGTSKARNPKIQTMLRLIGYGDNLGTGFPTLVDIWSTLSGQVPILEEKTDLQTVELHFLGHVLDDTKNDTKNDTKKTIERRDAILRIIRDDNTISQAKMAEMLGISEITLKRALKNMEDLVRHFGPKNGGYWQVIENKDEK